MDSEARRQGSTDAGFEQLLAEGTKHFGDVKIGHPGRSRWYHWIVGGLIRPFLLLIRPWQRIRIIGDENIPRTGPVIFVSNHESFMDPRIAILLNEHFIAIKVDREERPDVDDLYMTAVQMMTGAGGWPLSVFLTPTGAPFFGGTYFPPEERHGMPAFARLVQEIARLWRERRADLLADVDALTRALQAQPAPQPHAATAFGLSMRKPAPIRPST